MLLGRLRFLVLFLVLLYHVAESVVADFSPGHTVSVNKFACFDDDDCVSHTKASTPQPWRLVLLFGYDNVVIILITMLNIIVYKLRQFHESKFGHKDNMLLSSLGQRCRRFSLAEIERATNNFDDEFVIGQGGSGKVYKGIIDNRETIVAIKRLSSICKEAGGEFWREIEMVSQFKHCHLLDLIGYCHEWNEMILVYEYMPRRTLADHLHKSGRKGNTSPLSWVQRLRICIGAARGLDYLHSGTSTQQRVIHRDVKSTNILLDDKLEAKVADFGLSKIGPGNQACTHVSTNVRGTFGYIDPEYFLTRRLTSKSDVYAFGVVLFEVLCGRRAVDLSVDEDECGLVGWAQQCIKEGRVHQIIDSSLNMQILPLSLLAFVKIAEKCLHSQSKCRPTMAEVVVFLEFALAFQDSTNSCQVYEAIAHYYHNSRCSTAKEILCGVYPRNDIKPFQMKQTRLTLSRKIRQFLAAPIRLMSVHSRVDNKIRLNKIGVVPVVRGRIVTPNWKMFSLAELRRATRNFNPDMLLGEGRYGKVFMGWIDERTFAPARTGHGMPIAMTRFKDSEKQKYVQKEVDLYGRFHHPNLLKILGFCSDDNEFILVCEHLQKGSVERYLYKDYTDSLSWVVWLKVLIGAAQFLAFLHTAEEQIICSDFRPRSILLDEDFNARIADCGLARFGPADGDTIITQHQGLDTSGYSSPEYVKAGHLSVKNDVFSFGVLLLEIFTGMRMVDFERHKKGRLMDWTRPLLADKTRVKKVMNPKLLEHDRCPEDAFVSTIPALTLKCLDPEPENRPSMIKVLETLEKIHTFNKINCENRN